MSEEALSPRAKKLLGRIRQGAYYMAHSPRKPKAMAELEEAGLVTITGRAIVFQACYVPTTGYTPMVQERFEGAES